MNRNIAVAIAIVVVFGAFYQNLFPNLNINAGGTEVLNKFAEIFVENPLRNTENPISLDPVVFAAWDTFENYLEFARAHNLEGVRSLSHQISATCKDPSKVKECNELMDSVYIFAKDFKREYFTSIYYDDRQIVLLTDAKADMVSVALAFTRDDNGNPKVLGVKWCIPEKEEDDICIETDPATRDQDGNGWWDDVEAFFYK